MPDPGINRKEALQEWQKFLLAEGHVLKQNPPLLFQQAINQPDSSLLAQVAKSRFDHGYERRPFLIWNNKPQQLNTCVLTLVGHNKAVKTCTFSPDGKYIASVAETVGYNSHGTFEIIIWDTFIGSTVSIHTFHIEISERNQLKSILFSMKGNHVILEYEEGFAIWNVQQEKLLFDRLLSTYVLSPDGTKLVFSYPNECTMQLVDIQTGTAQGSLSGHALSVNWCDYSRDGKFIASGSSDGNIIIWDGLSGKELRTLFGHKDKIILCKFLPDMKRIVSLSADAQLIVWDIITWSAIASLAEIGGDLRSWAFSSNGQYFVMQNNEKISILDMDSLLKVAEWNSQGNDVPINQSRISPNGNNFIRNGFHSLKVFSMNPWRELAHLTGHSDELTSFSFSPDGEHIVSASMDGTLKVWSSSSFAELGTLAGHAYGVQAFSFSPKDGRIVSASLDGMLKIWNPGNLKNLNDCTRFAKEDIWSRPYSPDGDKIVMLAGNKDLVVRDSETGTELAVLAGQEQNVLASMFSNDGSRVYSISSYNEIKAWDSENWNRIYAKKMIGKFQACSYNGARIVSKTWPPGVFITDVETGEKLSSFEYSRPVDEYKLSPHGSYLALLSQEKTLFWDVQDGREIFILNIGKTGLESCEFSPNESQIILARREGVLSLVNLKTGSEMGFQYHNSVFACPPYAFSPDGKHIVSKTSDGSLSIWDSISTKRVAYFMHNDKLLESIAVSTDGKYIALASLDHTLKILESEGGEINYSYFTDVKTMAWNPNRMQLAIITKSDCLQLFKLENSLKLKNG